MGFSKDAFTPEDLDYINNYLVPKEIDYGIIYLANIASENFITQVITDLWQERVKGRLLVKKVQNLREALDWFEEKT